MAEIIRMPRMSDTMEEGNIVEWLKAEGDEVEPGDILAEVETDKATMELESYHEGVLLHIGVKEGAVPVNSVIAVIGEAGEDYKAILAEAENESSTNETSDASESEEKKNESSAATVETKADTSSSEISSSDRIKASPLARKMAKNAGIKLSDITGSGDQGRIVKRDVEAAIESNAKPSEVSMPTATTFEPSTEGKDIPVSQMRKTIARRLSESKYSAPHFYLTIEINMDRAIAFRKQVNAMDDVKISFNDIIVKAAAAALQKHPEVNASWLGDTIRENEAVNIGVAVAIDDGLMVPVIRNANHKSLTAINAEVKDKAVRARDRKLDMDEMQGNTFTISNLGMFNIEEFTAIINPPDSCIMAVGSIKQKPVVENGEIVVGNRMKVTLSCDHRVVDGAMGAQFLQTFNSIMEDPIRIMV